MSRPWEANLPAGESENLRKLRRRNRILALAIGLFALAMVILSYIMFSKYQFMPYE